MARTFAIGDIHGNYKGLQQVLERSEFNKEKDTLISLGDVADGWSEVPECVELLLECKHLIPIIGNHDEWTYKWMIYRTMVTKPDSDWYNQGGKATYEAYTIYHPDLIDKHAKEFFAKQKLFFIDEKNRLFVHAGFNRWESIALQRNRSLYWDRDLWNQALSVSKNNKLKTVDNFSKVFIGHTTTENWGETTPMYAGNLVWNLDTGSGWSGKLTIMDVDTEQYWQSDFVTELYKGEKGRK